MKKIKVIDVIKKTSDQISLKKDNHDSSVRVHANAVNEAKPHKAHEGDINLGRESEINLGKEFKKEVAEEHKSELRTDFLEKKEEPKIVHHHKTQEHLHHYNREDHERGDGKGNFRVYFSIVLAIVALIILGYLAMVILPRADLKIITKKADWEYNNAIGINPKIAEVDAVNRHIPVAVFYQKKNMTVAWPATGKKYLEQKATGVITIYNNYSSVSQPLVAGTRFQTPDGKIFKLVERVTVPGAKVSGGKITPSSIDANVIASSAGGDYNIGPVSKFTIPGFLGSDKYEKFYGASKGNMTGGLIGDGKAPVDSDIKAAKQNAQQQIQETLTSFLYSQIPQEGFKVIDSGKQFKILKETVNSNTDANGNFSVFVEAEGSVKAFKEADLFKLMAELGKQALGDDFDLKTYKVDYGDISQDVKSGISSLPIKFTSTFYKPVDVIDFKNKILGKSQDDLKNLVFSSTNIEKMDISFWPFWVKNVPTSEKRVKIEAD